MQKSGYLIWLLAKEHKKAGRRGSSSGNTLVLSNLLVFKMFSKGCGKSNKTFLVKRLLSEIFNLKI